ncbi:hypothetical protein M9Y10_003177 [Tritrichomonas musculus]|uniref:BTB domain-containing protein n=1 Tax=Tritrichomonas musculus TaxID=1915356 RepID=A0ABR2JP21_9EUKA
MSSEPINISMLKKKELNLLDSGKFTIIVKGKEYHCNIFGINSSEVIREFRDKNPELLQYEYNFDDPDHNFQLICDYFNFKKINITAQNMNSLRIISENLKINSRISDINNFVNSYEEIVQKTEPIKEIFNLLFHINENTIESTRDTILNSIWTQSEEKIKELASFIFQVVRSSYILQPYLVDLIISLDSISNDQNHLNHLKDFILKKIYSFFFTNQFYCCFIYQFIKKGLIQLESVTTVIFQLDPMLKLKDENVKYDTSSFANFEFSHHRNVVIWFLPEIASFVEQNKQTLSKETFK